MKQLLSVLLGIIIFTLPALAQNTESLSERLQRLDSLTSTYTFVWDADIQHTAVTSEQGRREMEQIAKSMGATLGPSCDGKVHVKKRLIIRRLHKDCAIQVESFDMCGTEVLDYPTSIYYTEGNIILGSSGRNLPFMTYVWRGSSPLYNLLPNMYLTHHSFPHPHFVFGLLCGANLLQLGGFEILRTRLEGNELSFSGALKYSASETFHNADQVSGRMINMQGRWAIKSFRIDYSGQLQTSYHSYIVENFDTVEGFPIPSRIVYEWKTEDDIGMRQTKAVFRLVQLKKTEAIDIDIPLGTQTNDLRLAEEDWYQSFRWAGGNPKQAVTYSWTGRLTSLKELQQIAYQQGNLLPPESPRRRYSLVMFAPALIFLLLAAYLFWRGRKK